MKLTGICIILLAVSLVSCGGMMKKVVGIKSPKVKTLEQINDSRFLDGIDQEKATDVVFMSPADSADILGIVLTPMTKRKDVFDEAGRPKYFTTFNGCGDVVLDGYDFSSGLTDYDSTEQQIYTRSFPSLDYLVQATATFDKNKLSDWTPPEADYYVVYYWSNIKGSPKRNRQNYENFKTEIRKSKDDVHIIRLNCDLIENWGLKKGKKIPLKFRKAGKSFLEYELLFGDLPY